MLFRSHIVLHFSLWLSPAKQKDDVNFAYFNDNVHTVTQHKDWTRILVSARITSRVLVTAKVASGALRCRRSPQLVSRVIVRVQVLCLMSARSPNSVQSDAAHCCRDSPVAESDAHPRNTANGSSNT